MLASCHYYKFRRIGTGGTVVLGDGAFARKTKAGARLQAHTSGSFLKSSGSNWGDKQPQRQGASAQSRHPGLSSA